MGDDPGDEVRSQQRTFWTLGDYVDFARRLQPAADSLIARVGVVPGQDVLDVATGTGNAALVAARAGATVTGLDLTPELFDEGRRRAAAEGLPIDWVEGDAERLPFADGTFDRVLSVFGAMFAPDQPRTAAELVRVCRPGGTVGVCSWTPTGVFGQMIILLITRSPQPPPPDFKPPGLWGVEQYVSGLFDGLDVEPLEFEREQVALEHDSPEAWVAELERVFGPVILARRGLGAAWEPVRRDLLALFEAADEGTDRRFVVQAEYLTTVARRPG